jgi:hypothetical protein
MLDWIVGYVESRFIITPHLQRALSQHFQVMRIDNGMEYVNNEFGIFFLEKRNTSSTSCCNTSP